MVSRLAFGCLLAICVAGCGKEPSSPSTGETPAAIDRDNSAVSGEGQASPSARPTEAQMAEVLGQLTQAVRKYGAEQRRVPKDLDEVVAAGYLNRVPAAPLGKKFAINKNLQVYLANR